MCQVQRSKSTIYLCWTKNLSISETGQRPFWWRALEGLCKGISMIKVINYVNTDIHGALFDKLDYIYTVRAQYRAERCIWHHWDLLHEQISQQLSAAPRASCVTGGTGWMDGSTMTLCAKCGSTCRFTISQHLNDRNLEMIGLSMRQPRVHVRACTETVVGVFHHRPQARDHDMITHIVPWQQSQATPWQCNNVAWILQ